MLRSPAQKQTGKRTASEDSAEQQRVQAQTSVTAPLILQRAYVDPSSLKALEVKQLQRTIGNRAVVGLFASSSMPQVKNTLQPKYRKQSTAVQFGSQPQRDAKDSVATPQPTTGVKRGFVVQRAGFSQYLSSNRLPDVITDSDKEEIVLAWMLDQNIHDLVELLSGSMEEPVLQEMAALTKHDITTGDVVSYLRSKGAPDSSAAPLDHMAFLNEFMKVAPLHLTSKISSSIKTDHNQDASVVKWHGLTKWGAGTGVTLLMRPGGLVKGSTPKGSPVWMKQLEQHVPINGGTTIYVQGHLLNHNIGGPGLDYNMVPLTGKPAKNVGANDANAEHLNLIETAAKDTWDKVEEGSYPEAQYEVIPDYSRAPRPGTGQIRGEANKFNQIRLAWIQDRAKFVAQQSATDIAKVYEQTLKSFGIPVPQTLPPQEQMIQELSMKMASDDLDKTYGALKLAKHPLAASIEQNIDAGVINASALGNQDNMTIKDLLYVVNENAKVWEAEDQYVPNQLHVSLHWKDDQAQVHKHPTSNVPIVLPSLPAAVGFRAKKQSEDA